MSPWRDNGDRTAVLSQRVPVLEGAALRTIQISTEWPLCNSMSAARERYNAATRRQTGHCLGDPVTFHFAVAGALAMTRSTAPARKEVPIVICLGFVVAGILLFLIYIGSLLLFLEPLLITMGFAPDPMVWSAGSMPERRRLVHAVRDLALLPGPPAIWLGEWVAGPCVAVGADDVAQWLYTPGLLVKWVSFLGSLHWPAHDGDLGVGGISYVELLILYELWAGERLVLEKAHPRDLRPGRSIAVSAVPFGPGIDIWRSCRFIGAMMRSLCLFAWWSWSFCAMLYWC